jgi:hypothetical protein
LVTRAGRGKGRANAANVSTPAERRAAMRWAQRLNRVFGTDVETCAGCGSAMMHIALRRSAGLVERLDFDAISGEPRECVFKF